MITMMVFAASDDNDFLSTILSLIEHDLLAYPVGVSQLSPLTFFQHLFVFCFI